MSAEVREEQPTPHAGTTGQAKRTADATIRAWARHTGQPVGDRGRVRTRLREAYETALDAHTAATGGNS